jgi:hypothetical protein
MNTLLICFGMRYESQNRDPYLRQAPDIDERISTKYDFLSCLERYSLPHIKSALLSMIFITRLGSRRTEWLITYQVGRHVEEIRLKHVRCQE